MCSTAIRYLKKLFKDDIFLETVLDEKPSSKR